MQETIEQLRNDGWITPEEAASVLATENAMHSVRFTIGSETELVYSATPNMPNVAVDLDADAREQARDAVAVLELVYGFSVDSDGVYEIITPEAHHPRALHILARALVRMGFLPDGTHSLVTNHLNSGSPLSVEQLEDRRGDLTLQLRAMEQLGFTTPSRLLAPLLIADSRGDIRADKSWNSKGIVGLKLENMEKLLRWAGLNRVEFRTLQFHDAEQHGAESDVFYLFNRALLQPSTDVAASLYEAFDTEVQEYFHDNVLPDTDPELMEDSQNLAALRAYIMPYARHLATGDRSQLRRIAETALEDLAEEFGMQDVVPLIRAQFETNELF